MSCAIIISDLVLQNLPTLIKGKTWMTNRSTPWKLPHCQLAMSIVFVSITSALLGEIILSFWNSMLAQIQALSFSSTRWWPCRQKWKVTQSHLILLTTIQSTKAIANEWRLGSRVSTQEGETSKWSSHHLDKLRQFCYRSEDTTLSILKDTLIGPSLVSTIGGKTPLDGGGLLSYSTLPKVLLKWVVYTWNCTALIAHQKLWELPLLSVIQSAVEDAQERGHKTAMSAEISGWQLLSSVSPPAHQERPLLMINTTTALRATTLVTAAKKQRARQSLPTHWSRLKYH